MLLKGAKVKGKRQRSKADLFSMSHNYDGQNPMSYATVGSFAAYNFGARVSRAGA